MLDSMQPDSSSSGAAGGESTADFHDAATEGLQARTAFDAVLAAIEEHGQELLGFPGVVSIRPGYRFQGARITPEPVITVSVLRKQDIADLPAHSVLPRQIDGVTVDVVPATPMEQIRFLEQQDSAATDLVTAGVAAGSGFIDLTLPGERSLEAESPGVGGEGLAAFAPPRSYQPPDEPLNPVKEEMTVVCHASPDAGWRNLGQFLEGTQQRLTATMYEFTARHILDTLLGTLQAPRHMRFILDAGPQTQRQHEVSKEEARQALADALQQRFTFVWAPVVQDSKTTAGFFPSAYHIKVAVRDGESLWLSSGNWKESGQPPIDPIHGPLPPNFNLARFQSRSNREWHVIVHNPSLAGLLETYISHDIAQATPLQIADAGPLPVAAMPDLFVPEALLAEFESAVPPQFFAEREFTRRLRVQPLLTPDNYVDHVLPLIEGAREKLYFQNQSLNPNRNNQRFSELIQALRDKSRDPDVDVRIIVRGDFDPGEILTELQGNGFEMSRVKLQNACHNKGILIDDQIVVVGSHNWTGQGTTENRDASLIFHDREIVEYYTRLFLYDWENLARFENLEMAAMPLVASQSEPTPPGMTRIAWHDYYQF
jgi:hypothetical protein